MGSLLQMFHNSICLNFKVEDSAKILLDMLSQKSWQQTTYWCCATSQKIKD